MTRYKGVFNVTNSNNKFYFTKSTSYKVCFIQIKILQGVYELASLNDEIRRNNIDEGHFTEAVDPFTIKPNFSTLSSIIEISKQELLNSFPNADSIRNLEGFDASTIYEENNLARNPVKFLRLDNFFLETDIAQGMIFKSRQSDIIHNWKMTVDPGYRYVEIFAGKISWCLMDSKDFISSISFILQNENGNLVSFNGQSLTFRF